MNMNEKEVALWSEGGLNVTLTIRLLMHCKSGARINISDGSSTERIVTITGGSEVIFKAFAMIAEKFEEDILACMVNSTVSSRPPVTLRLVFPASQCGSLIGKGGSKIKEIRETTGAQVQVAGDLLPESTERAVTISGTPTAITQCVRHICIIMLESPPKGATIPYRPKPSSGGNPAFFSQAHSTPTFAVPAQYTIPPHDLTKLQQLAMQHIPFTSLGQSNPTFPGLDMSVSQSSYELSIPNELIGCIIGRQGSKINEIRQMSGAQIKIASAIDGSAVRHVTITGSPASICLAHYLISASLELAKLSIQAASSSTSNTVDLGLSFSQSASPASASAAMLATPPAINIHSPSAIPSIPTTHYALPVSSLLGMKTLPLLAVHTAASPGFATYTTKNAASATIKKSERQRFAPY
ncbi:Poly(rC)-binding protein 3 [Bagarius yarrelli]|uniref:Poly(RC)-binding protein 3 n=1 Tax=Bagarius yarrelli TaxID=175774 RepID=A0A556TN85_BAGYA|nr:Poly(rC)-binding protein 3 [Bagarius yarrelli]